MQEDERAGGVEEEAQGALSPEQTEKLLQFQDLTGMESMEQCRRTLQQHQWNIEAAVQDRLNEQEGVPRVFDPPPPPPRPPPTPQTHPGDSRVYSYVERANTPRGFLGWSCFLLTLPFRFTFHTLVDLFRFAVRLWRADPRLRVSDPVGDVTSFIVAFREQFPGDQGRFPAFYQGSYSQALSDAKRELKFLVVYLHVEQHPDTNIFCRDTLCHVEVVDFINARTIFWACSTSRPEGYRVSQALRSPGCPFLAVLVLRGQRMTVVGRLEGALPPSALTAQLGVVMERNQYHLDRELLQREERSETQALRLQQDEAYLVSLRADQEKERLRRERREAEELESQRRDADVERESQRRQEVVRERERRALLMPDEPPAGHPGAITAVFKLPDGTRLARRFLDTHTTEAVYNFVFSHREAPEVFQIVCNFPRRVLCAPQPSQPPQPPQPSQPPQPPQPPGATAVAAAATPHRFPTLKEAGLGRSEVLFVQDLGEDE